MAGSHPISLTLGNEAIAQAALERGLNYAAGYPGTHLSEIIQEPAVRADSFGPHVERSINEKTACEGSAAEAVVRLIGRQAA